MRVLRGRVIIREDLKADTRQYTHIIAPDVSTKDDADAVAVARTWHVGTVLAKGPPALTRKGVEVPHGFEVGDTVYFHWAHYEKGFTRVWEDGELACWVPQECVDAVVEKELPPIHGVLNLRFPDAVLG